jgi:5-methylcytosine-specific restriction endonuclease McrA
VKRGGPLRRVTPLRGTSTLKRTPLKVGKPKRRRRRTAAINAEIARLSRGRCVRCKTKRALQPHHVLDVQMFSEHELEPRNIVLVCAGCHDEHTRAHRRLRIDELPDEVIAFVYSTGGREVLHLERYYKTAPGGTGHR